MSWEVTGLYVVLILILAALFLLRHSLPSYSSEKGKNLATKQDVAKITEEAEKARLIYTKQLEEIQQQNRLILEDFRNRNQLRLAALDKRLEVHQQAYILWRRMVRSIDGEDEIFSTVTKECKEWWEINCLYLTADARNALFQSFRAAWYHRDSLQRRFDSEKNEKPWEVLMKAGEAIVKGVSLPPIESEGASLNKYLETLGS